MRNVKMSWADAKNSKNFLWEKGFQFYCLTPKSRHSVHSSWANVDWHLIWNSNFGDPYRVDKRLPNVGEHQIPHESAGRARSRHRDGDYVYVDANPADRPYLGATPSDPFYKVSRLMLRLTYNTAYPYNVVMMKHGAFIATEKTVKGDADAGPMACRSPRKVTSRTSASARSNLSRATGTCRCTRPTRCFTNRKPS